MLTVREAILAYLKNLGQPVEDSDGFATRALYDAAREELGLYFPDRGLKIFSLHLTKLYNDGLISLTRRGKRTFYVALADNGPEVMEAAAKFNEISKKELSSVDTSSLIEELRVRIIQAFDADISAQDDLDRANEIIQNIKNTLDNLYNGNSLTIPQALDLIGQQVDLYLEG